MENIVQPYLALVIVANHPGTYVPWHWLVEMTPSTLLQIPIIQADKLPAIWESLIVKRTVLGSKKGSDILRRFNKSPEQCVISRRLGYHDHWSIHGVFQCQTLLLEVEPSLLWNFCRLLDHEIVPKDRARRRKYVLRTLPEFDECRVTPPLYAALANAMNCRDLMVNSRNESWSRSRALTHAPSGPVTHLKQRLEPLSTGLKISH